jgi:hypothetical protein
MVYLADQIPTLRGRALATQQAVIALGIIIGAPAGGIIIEQYCSRASILCESRSSCGTDPQYLNGLKHQGVKERGDENQHGPSLGLTNWKER